MSLSQEVIKIASSHPLGDYVVGIPVSALLLWTAKILNSVSQDINKIKQTLYGVEGTPGIVHKVEELHRKS